MQTLRIIANWFITRANRQSNHSILGSVIRYLMRSVMFLVMLFMMLGTSSLAWGQSEKKYQQSLNNISSEIKQISKTLNANKSKLETEQTQLLRAEQALYKINNKLKDAQQQIQTIQGLIAEQEQQQQQLQQQQQDSRDALASLVVANYKNGRANQLQKVLSQENPYAVGRLNNYQRYFTDAIQQKFAALEEQVQQSRILKKQHKQSLADLQVLEQEQEFLKKTQEAKRLERKKAVNTLSAKVQANESKLKKLNSDRKRLNNLIKQLEKQRKELERIERERKEAERIAREKAKQAGKKPPKPVVRTPVKGGFRKQKGRLTCPVGNQAKTKFGQRIVSSGMKSEGVFYQTKQSVDVRSIFRGQVLFADFLKGFGLLLIVDHGDDHISLYGHNKVLYKKVGDTVSTNEVISKTGTTGGLKSNGLYFEIRNNTTPVNPSQWCQ